MSSKTKTFLARFALSFFFGLLFFLGGFLSSHQGVLEVKGKQIVMKNPLAYDNVNSLSSQIRSYLLVLVGGIAIVFIAVSGILYILGGLTMNEALVNASKKALIGSVAGLVIISISGVLINEIYFIVMGSELHDWNSLSAKKILLRLVNFLLAIVGTISLIMMVIGGIWFFMGSGDEDKVIRGKQFVKYSIIGITVALSGVIIIRQISVIIGG